MASYLAGRRRGKCIDSLSAMNFALKLDDITAQMIPHPIETTFTPTEGDIRNHDIHMEGMYSNHHEVKSAHENHNQFRVKKDNKPTC